MSLLDDLVRLAGQSVGDTLRFAERATALIQDRVQQHPEEVFGVLRDVRPVFVHDGMAVVTRFPDVVEVLTHDREFTVDAYTAPMDEITGDFILGLNDGPHYERDVSLLRLAFRQSDLPGITELVDSEAARLVDEARPLGRIDVVKDVCDAVPAKLAEAYLGAPGPDRETLIEWAKVLFTDIFANPKRDPIVTKEALAAAAWVRPHVDGLVAIRKRSARSGEHKDDVLGRLLREQVSKDTAFSDEEIRSNLIGLLVGMIPTTSKASALALDELFRRPRELAEAQAAARAGDDVLLGRYVNEAMRLAPQAPGLIRHAVVDYPIARGTHHETMITAGTVVFASTQSAMLDSAFVPSPEEFRLDRPDSVYLHFGTGLHRCFGRYVNPVSISAIVRAVLSLPDAHRAAGPAGQLSVVGNFPTSMTLEFATG
ncbi:cytochrome P450 [Frankia tisae]|uniref:cytochrome P450 n=1 Tax=Frankia tisae TaxID=2950104 RepID=UPI0021C0F844|nr:cytochrome P450 [Frankia tisae]